MMRIAELPRAIRAAISDWRLWVTVSLTAAVIINEAVIGISEGQPLSVALTRMPFYRTLYLLLVFSIIGQGGIVAVTIVMGVLVTLYDWALQRRRNWKEEGKQEAQQHAQQQVQQAQQEAQQQVWEAQQQVWEAQQQAQEAQQQAQEAQRQILRDQIDKVLADATLTPEQKNHFIAILNAR